MNSIKKQIEKDISNMNIAEKVDYINELREFIHCHSPFKHEPVDFVKWVLSDNVVANDYNPNKVAPPEMELLEVSIMNDGYTQPIVTWQNDDKEKTEVIDGFHRNRVGKESIVIRDRVKGYLPVVDIRKEQSSKNDRMASTIRHNRARGKHQVDAMSEIVIELKNRNWSNKRVAKQLGMDEEEILRLCQISGLEDMFSDNDFSKSWVADDENADYELLTDNIPHDVMDLYRIPHENDKSRIFHTYDKWECHKAGFYANNHPLLDKTQSINKFIEVMTDKKRFKKALNRVITEWTYSCQHYLSNKHMNRIAWLGQAAICIETGVPSKFSGAWFDLSEDQQNLANKQALKALNKWLKKNGRECVKINEAMNSTKQVELY